MNMENYKKEDLILFNMDKVKRYVPNPPSRNGLEVFAIEEELSVAEKIKFIDSMEDGIATYLLTIFDKWEKEKEGLSKDAQGRIRTNSKKAWIKRTDTKEKIDSLYSAGEYNLFQTRFNGMSAICPKMKGNRYDMAYTGKDVVHQWFHDLCNMLYYGEKRHFEANDPKHIKYKKVREYGERYSVCFDNEELMNIIWNNTSIDEVKEGNLDKYIRAYGKLEKCAIEITNDLNG